MKYITSKDGEMIIFSIGFSHDEMARKTIGIKNVVGAGFVSLSDATCYGRSISLGIDSREDDTILLKNQY